MYRGQLWTMRQFAGFGTSEETNERFRYLLDHGQTGLSTAFDMPSLMGHDSDHPRGLGEVGREGVAIDTLDDMQTLFGGIDLGEVSVSMTINAPAAIMLAFYVAAAEADPLGATGPVPPERLSGTIQADILKEYIAQKEWCFPIDPAMRLCGDMIEWCTHHMPRWHPISISGYHIREAGSTAQQELAFTLKDGLTYVEQAVARGLDVDDFAPRLSFFFNAQIDFFEEIAKYRAARRIWARELRERFGAKSERSLQMRFHTQTAGRQPDRAAAAQQHRAHDDRGARGRARRHAVAAHQLLRRGARAADRGGGHDRAAHAADDRARDRRREHGRPARRQLLRRGAHRRDGAHAYGYFDKIDELGGMVEAVKRNYPQREIADAAFAHQQEVDSGERVVVGVNRFVAVDEQPIPTLRIDPALERKQIGRLQAARARRDGAAVEAALATLREDAAHEQRNLMDPLLECARAHATEGEIVRVAAAGVRRLHRDARLLARRSRSSRSRRATARGARPGDRALARLMRAGSRRLQSALKATRALLDTARGRSPAHPQQLPGVHAGRPVPARVRGPAAAALSHHDRGSLGGEARPGHPTPGRTGGPCRVRRRIASGPSDGTPTRAGSPRR